MGRTKWAIVLAAVCLVVAIAAVAYAAGQAKAVKVLSADVMRAKRFEVIGENGRPSAVIRDGDLRLLYASGRPAVVIGPGAVFIFGDQKKPGGISLDVMHLDGKGASVRLLDDQMDQRAALCLDADGSPGFALLPSMGAKGGVTMGLYNEGDSSLSIFDTKGRARVELGLSRDLTPSLTLADGDGTTRAQLGALALLSPRTGGREQRPESSLVLFDKEGKVLWQAP